MADNLRPHQLRDDLESFVHVLFYHVLRYRPVYQGDESQLVLRHDMDEVFCGDQWRISSGRIVGGREKA